MTATYDITTNVGRVRLITGDNDLTDVIFTDEEIEQFLSFHSDNVALASASLLEAWAAKYTASPDSEKIGDYAYTQKIVANMLKLAKRLRDADSDTPVLEWAQIDLTFGSGITAEED